MVVNISLRGPVVADQSPSLSLQVLDQAVLLVTTSSPLSAMRTRIVGRMRLDHISSS